jgi:uncharacterized repeat protein (TIGR03843 family)
VTAQAGEELPGEELRSGDLQLVGQLVDASNASMLCTLPSSGARVIYKPRAGERPLWDFPAGTLSQREVAARVVSEALGWQIVPPTVWRDGPFGPGMVQLWIDTDPEVDLVAFVQSDDAQLRRIAVFDALINNGDRKGGHLLPTTSGQVWGIDHGVTFAVEDKLRTVLWQWRGSPIPQELLDDVDRWVSSWDTTASPSRELSQLLSPEECTALRDRAAALLADGRHPQPSPDWPAIPWPPF